MRTYSIDQYRDVESLNYYNILRGEGKSEAETLDIIAQRSRDNGRTPMQWDASANAGFTTGTPWIGTADNYQTINAAAEVDDPDSVRSFYKTLVHLRKQHKVISEGKIEFLFPEKCRPAGLPPLWCAGRRRAAGAVQPDRTRSTCH